MIKRIALYISWDVLMLIFTSSYSSVVKLLKEEYMIASPNFFLCLYAHVIFLILVGGMIAWPVYISNQYQFTRKQALLELILIGGPALYLSTIVISYFLVPYHPHRFIFTNTESMTVGSIVFGYELCMFVIRIVKSKKLEIPAEPES